MIGDIIYQQIVEALKHKHSELYNSDIYEHFQKKILNWNNTHVESAVLQRWAGDTPPEPIPADKVVYTPTVYGDIDTKNHPNIVTAPPLTYAVMYNLYNTPKFKNKVPTRTFNCFINRLDPLRQSWFYMLIRNKLFDKQHYISFNMESDRNDYRIDLRNSPWEFFEYCHQTYLTEFDAEYKICKEQNLLPYKNFFENDDLRNLVLDSKFSIVIETYFQLNRTTFTEKTFRVLLLPRPWLLFCSTNAVAQLKSWGFDVLDDLVDHSRYDHLEFEIDRQSVIIQMAKELEDFDTELHRSRLEQAQQHNIDLIYKWRKDCYNILLPVLDEASTKVWNILKIKHNL